MERRPPLVVSLLPRRTLSRFTDFLARRRLPGFLLRPVLRWYAKRYGVDLAEAARPLREYRSFVDFFTRRLRDDARTMPDDPEAIACPCDGTASMSGVVEDGTLVQVKGHTYPLSALLADPGEATAFEGGTYLVLYLAPGDYHRYHWPWAGTIDTVRHVRGDLWPVNERSVGSVEGLFARNERVVCLGRTQAGGRFAYVPVGALNVGSIRLDFHDLRTNRLGGPPAERWPVDVSGKRGDLFGLFELGSTIVLLLAADAGRLEPPAPGSTVRVGDVLGSTPAP